MPPKLTPPMNESARLPFRSELASMYRSRGTSDTNNELYETWNSTLSVPSRNPTTYSCSSVSASKA